MVYTLYMYMHRFDKAVCVRCVYVSSAMCIVRMVWIMTFNYGEREREREKREDSDCADFSLYVLFNV